MQTKTWLSRDPVSRRKLFKSAGITWVGGSAVFLAACGTDDNTSGNAAGGGIGAGREGGQPTDADLLNGALDLEHMAVAAYTAGAEQLDGEVLRTARQFLAHEQEHVDALTAAIRQSGGTPNKARAEYELPELNSEEDVLRFAEELENTAIAAYIDVLPRLGTGQLRATAASIIANEAEHLTALRVALGEEGVPDAFVTGKKEES